MKHSVFIAGRKTSVSLEDAFWKCLQEIAAAKEMKLSALVASIDKDRQQGNLSSAIRLFVLDHFKSRAAAAGSDPKPHAAIPASPSS